MNNLSTDVSNTSVPSTPTSIDSILKPSNKWAAVCSQGLAVKAMVFVCFTLFSVSLQAATFPVLNTDDAGPGSLREAITIANATPGLDDITFTGVSGTLTLATALPDITEGVTMDGTTAAGYVAGTPSYTIEGNNITFRNTTNTSVTSLIVKGLAFQDSDGTPSTSGVRFFNSFSSAIKDCSFHTLRSPVSVSGGEDITVLDNSFVNCGHSNNYSIAISNVGGTAPNKVNVSGSTLFRKVKAILYLINSQ